MERTSPSDARAWRYPLFRSHNATKGACAYWLGKQSVVLGQEQGGVATVGLGDDPQTFRGVEAIAR